MPNEPPPSQTSPSQEHADPPAPIEPAGAAVATDPAASAAASAPRQEESPAGGAATDAPGQRAAAAPEPVDAEDAHWTWLDKADRKRLRSHPAVAGLLGSDLERERAKLTQSLIPELTAKIRQQLEDERLTAVPDADTRLEGLREADPELAQLAERSLREAQERVAARRAEAEAAKRTQAQQSDAEREEAILQQRAAKFQATLAAPVQAQLAGQTFDSFSDYMQRAAELQAEHLAAQKAAEVTAQLRKEYGVAAAKDQATAARQREDARLDLDGGQASSSAVTLAQWASWPSAQRRQWQATNPQEYAALTSGGVG